MDRWKIVHECDDEENGISTCWALEINNEKYGKYAWISLNPQGSYDVECKPNVGDFLKLKTCKTLRSAKRWVSMNIK